MEVEEIKDSVKNWFDEKLKNPYFAAVLVVWVVTNRVVVFSIFNFSEAESLPTRIDIIHRLLANKKVAVFQGFYGIIFYSFIVGFITMVFYNYLNVIAKWTYNYFDKWANVIRRDINPPLWVLRSTIQEELERNVSLEQEINANKLTIKTISKENEVAILTLNKNNEETKNLKIEIEKQKVDISLLKTELESKNSELNNIQNELEKHQLELADKIIKLQKILPQSEFAPSSTGQWIYRNTCLVHDFIFEEKYKVSVDTYCDNIGWEIQLFGRNEADSLYLFNVLGSLENFLPLPFKKYEIKNNRLIFRKFSFTAGIEQVAESLKLLLSHLESNPLVTVSIKILSAAYLWDNGKGKIDVTSKIKELVAKGVTTIMVDPSVFEMLDPAIGRKKTLSILCKIKGQEREFKKNDGERLVLE